MNDPTGVPKSKWSWRRRVLIALAVFLGLVVISQLFAYKSISRESLRIAISEEERTACRKWAISIQQPKFDRERGSYDYLKYAVAAADVYDRSVKGAENGVNFKSYQDGWDKAERHRKEFKDGFFPTGLVADYYFKDEPDHLLVLIAFRGTAVARDWLSNASWFLRWVPFLPDHYDDARDAFSQIRKEAIAKANGRPISFVTTGHSLGGGVALHVAYGFPCVSSVVFNGSPVINKHFYKESFDDINVALLHQRCEVLGWARKIAGGEDSFPGANLIQWFFGGANITTNYHFYPYDLYIEDDIQLRQKKGEGTNCLTRMILDRRPYHNMDYYVAGLARLATDCEYDVASGDRKNKCDFPEFLAARRTFCTFYGTKRGFGTDHLCQCRNWPDRQRLKAAGACFDNE